MILDDLYTRTKLVLGEVAVEKLKRARAIVFGAGGVGGAAIEALARGGIGSIAVVDSDSFAPSNLNRQILASTQTIGRKKAEVAVERILSINPDCNAAPIELFYLPETAKQIDLKNYDIIIDAVDTVSAKIEIAERSRAAGVYEICCLGTGNKTDPSRLKISDLYQTSVCPLARVMRRELKARGFIALPVVWSDETPIPPKGEERTVGSVSFVPPVAGYLAASAAIRFLLK